MWAIAKVMVRALFYAGHETVIVDATNNTRKRRAEWSDPEWATEFRVLNTPAEECIRRARATWDEKIIPVIERMAAEHEPLCADDSWIALPPATRQT